MSRIKGAIDKKPRKKRTHYAGKPIKKTHKSNGFVRYVSTRKRDDPIKLWMIEIRDMDKDSYRNFSKETRKYMRRKVYVPRLRIDVDSYQISNKQLVEQLCLEHLWVGHWLIRGFSRGRNKFHCKPVPLAEVIITDSSSGMRAKLISNIRLFRYWFWEANSK